MALVKYNNNSISAVTTTALAEGNLVPIKTLTASSSSTLSFVDGSNGVVLDNTYPIYLFKFINIHPGTDDKDFQFNLSVDSGSNYNVTKTDSVFRGYHTEDDSGSGLGIQASMDLAQSTSFANFCSGLGNGNDESLAGEMFLFNPSSTTFIKHYITHTISYHGGNLALDQFSGGYGNTTSAIDGVRFQMSSGNIDSGKIKLYGLKDS